MTGVPLPVPAKKAPSWTSGRFSFFERERFVCCVRQRAGFDHFWTMRTRELEERIFRRTRERRRHAIREHAAIDVEVRNFSAHADERRERDLRSTERLLRACDGLIRFELLKLHAREIALVDDRRITRARHRERLVERFGLLLGELNLQTREPDLHVRLLHAHFERCGRGRS